MANKAPAATGGKEGQYARYLARVAGSPFGAVAAEEKHSELGVPSAAPDIPLSPDDSLAEHMKQIYENNPVLWGSALALMGLWAFVKLRA